MTNQDILSHVDHTLLSPTATETQLIALCEEALEHQTASVCIPPSFVSSMRTRFAALNIGTVASFPLGYDSPWAKRDMVLTALDEGANEIDVVVNLIDVKDGNFDRITEEIRLLREAAGMAVLKIIIETCYLTREEKIALCRCVGDGGADFIKTSTGFGTGGATAEDVRLLREHTVPQVRVKASGGMRTREDLEQYLALGSDRLGTSKALEILGLKS